MLLTTLIPLATLFFARALLNLAHSFLVSCLLRGVAAIFPSSTINTPPPPPAAPKTRPHRPLALRSYLYLLFKFQVSTAGLSSLDHSDRSLCTSHDVGGNLCCIFSVALLVWEVHQRFIMRLGKMQPSCVLEKAPHTKNISVQ